VKDTILIVDDNEALRELIQELVENSGYKVVTLSNVNEAKIFLANPANVARLKSIVTDLLMYPSDGFDFMAYIESRPELVGIHLYLLTGASIDVFESKLSRHKYDAIIEKPFKSDVLVSTICGTVRDKKAS